MKLEQKQPTPPLIERVDSVLIALHRLTWMRGFPTGDNIPQQLEVIATAIARFCQTVQVNHKSDPETSSTGSTTLDLGWVVPLEWLVSEVASTFEWFPPPIRWRMVYETRFVPLDKKTSSDLTGVVED